MKFILHKIIQSKVIYYYIYVVKILKKTWLIRILKLTIHKQNENDFISLLKEIS